MIVFIVSALRNLNPAVILTSHYFTLCPVSYFVHTWRQWLLCSTLLLHPCHSYSLTI